MSDASLSTLRPNAPRTPLDWLRLWLLLRDPVGRREYATSGPHAYWTIWSDWLVHRIHQRVLRHIKRLAEEDLE